MADLERGTREYKIIRDPVQKDIALSELEARLVDSPAFQRLRRIRQLGTAHLLYPAALHTRFDHSLGTLAETQRMVHAVNHNPDSGRLNDSDEVVVRVAALLHDVPHVPFGHTLEDEAGLFPRHDNAENYSGFLAENGLFAPIFEDVLGAANGSAIRSRVLNLLAAKTDEEIEALGEDAVLADIVGNTICADLLDYLKRDTYFTGLEECIGDRILKYLYVYPFERSRRLVLRLYKLSSLRTRSDVASEALDLLRVRYILAERVYYHHSKMCTSAMVAAAVQYSALGTRQQLYGMGDDELVAAIAADSSKPKAARIAQALIDRRLYKPVYLVGYSQPTFGDPKEAKVDDLVQRLGSPKGREDLEARIESRQDLPAGSVILYCPDPAMQLKAAKARVAWYPGKVTTLENASDQSYREEIRIIQRRHQGLWRTMGYVHEDAIERAWNVADDLSALLGLPNEHPVYSVRPLVEIVAGTPAAGPLEEWLKQFGWIRHPALEDTLADTERLRSMGFQEVSTEEGISQVNLQLHLNDILESASDKDPLYRRRAELREIIRSEPAQVLGHTTGFRQATVRGRRRDAQGTATPAVAIIEQAFRAVLEGRKLL